MFAHKLVTIVTIALVAFLSASPAQAGMVSAKRHAFCRTDASCWSDHYCGTDRKCAPKLHDGEECSLDKACWSGKCDSETGACVSPVAAVVDAAAAVEPLAKRAASASEPLAKRATPKQIAAAHRAKKALHRLHKIEVEKKNAADAAHKKAQHLTRVAAKVQRKLAKARAALKRAGEGRRRKSLVRKVKALHAKADHVTARASHAKSEAKVATQAANAATAQTDVARNEYHRAQAVVEGRPYTPPAKSGNGAACLSGSTCASGYCSSRTSTCATSPNGTSGGTAPAPSQRAVF
ncbi:unnamed protein product [Parajaminaea phylloscopi]